MSIGRQTLHLLWQVITDTGLFDRMKDVLHAYDCPPHVALLFNVDQEWWGEDIHATVHQRLLDVQEAVEHNAVANQEWDDGLRRIVEAVLCEILDAGRGRIFPELEPTYTDRIREWVGRLHRCLEQDGYEFREGKLLSHQRGPEEKEIDPVTQVLNRGAIMARLDEAMARCDRSGFPIAIVFMDLDNFKALNDTLGHQAGDAALSAVGATLNRITQGKGPSVGRYGGDEFLLVGPNHTCEEVLALAERIRQDIERDPACSFPNGLTVSCSVGVAARVPSEGFPSEELVRRADLAAQMAKAEGKGCVVAYSDSAERAREEVELQFRYQGSLPIEIGRRITLIRWRHHPGEDDHHFEAQVVMSKGSTFESDNMRVMSTIEAWTAEIPGIVKSFRQSRGVAEFGLLVTRDFYEVELRPTTER